MRLEDAQNRTEHRGTAGVDTSRLGRAQGRDAIEAPPLSRTRPAGQLIAANAKRRTHKNQQEINEYNVILLQQLYMNYK